ncbi:serine/threonine-protein kinase [Vibrio nereis]|uniref:serine/threonine-protein kinase n=1 Tax=Vibrio nereis TaxID=693 RepID=UPI0024943DFB|nr:serine/threonine-protein kinase [Vibrio nereis]
MNNSSNHAETTSTFRLGQILNERYQVTSLLGTGGLCEVYQATDLLLESAKVKESVVAIKVLKAKYCDDPQYTKLLIKEAKQTRSLCHQNIVKVFSLDFDEYYYIVMELLDGETLDDVIRRSRPNGLNAKSTIPILKQVASAFKYAHSKGIVHSDLKPSNIMLTRSGIIKILDFGVARASNDSIDKYSSINLEETSIVSGYTPAYASPNLMEGDKVTIQDDIFSFSCIAYELLTSKHPFNRKTSLDARKHQMQVARPAQVPRSLWKALFLGLKFQPSERLKAFDEIEPLLVEKSYNVSILATCGLLSMLGLASLYVNMSNTIALLENQKSELEKTNLYKENLFSLSTDQLIGTISSIPEKYDIEKEALTRLRQNEIISVYQKKVEKILNTKQDNYPDYYALSGIMNEALSLYPDSHALHEIDSRIMLSWQASKQLLIEQINHSLETGNYITTPNANKLTDLKSKIEFIDHDFSLKPNKKSTGLFAKKLNTAMASLDINEIQKLIPIGKDYFSTDADIIPLLSDASNLVEAIMEMETYKKSLKSDSKLDFPYQSAIQYYRLTFKDYEKQLKQVKRARDLYALEDEVNALSKELPKDFSPLIRLQLEMAKRYLNFSDEFLKLRHQRSANAVMKRATALFAKIEESQKFEQEAGI